MMMKRYIAHIKSKPTHHRRQHAAQVAGILTALAVVVWLTTLPFRFGGSGGVAANTGGANTDAQQTQLAGVGSTDGSGNGNVLQVVGTTTSDGTSGSSSSGSVFSNY